MYIGIIALNFYRKSKFKLYNQFYKVRMMGILSPISFCGRHKDDEIM